MTNGFAVDLSGRALRAQAGNSIKPRAILFAGNAEHEPREQRRGTAAIEEKLGIKLAVNRIGHAQQFRLVDFAR